MGLRNGQFVPFGPDSAEPTALPEWDLYPEVAIRNAVEAWRKDGGPILLLGRSDFDERDAGLAERRTDAVARLLERAGIPWDQIWTRVAAPSPPQAPEAREANRRGNRMVQMTMPLANATCRSEARQAVLDWVVRHCVGPTPHSDCNSAIAELRRRL